MRFIPIKKEPRKPPKLADLEVGTVFALEPERNRLYIRTRYDGEDFRGYARWHEGGQGYEMLHRQIDSCIWNKGKSYDEEEYVAVIALCDGEDYLLHKDLLVIPMDCELHYQEKEEFIS